MSDKDNFSKLLSEVLIKKQKIIQKKIEKINDNIKYRKKHISKFKKLQTWYKNKQKDNLHKRLDKRKDKLIIKNIYPEYKTWREWFGSFFQSKLDNKIHNDSNNFGKRRRSRRSHRSRRRSRKSRRSRRKH
jgi:hypothetical protein